MRPPLLGIRQGGWEARRGVRLLMAATLVAVAVGFFVAARPVHAYPCITRSGSTHRDSDERCRPQRRAPRAQKHSSFAELAVAGGMIVAILLLPLVPKNLDVWNDSRANRGRF
jgi:hypothetical protein